VKAANPSQAAAIDVLTAYNGVLGKPVADAFGTGETNDGGDGQRRAHRCPERLQGAPSRPHAIDQLPNLLVMLHNVMPSGWRSRLRSSA